MRRAESREGRERASLASIGTSVFAGGWELEGRRRHGFKATAHFQRQWVLIVGPWAQVSETKEHGTAEEWVKKGGDRNKVDVTLVRDTTTVDSTTAG